MGFLDRILGNEPGANEQQRSRPASEDEVAVERYRYLLRTAPPETIEQVHREAFAKLTDAQRALIYEELSRGAQTGERPLSSEPATLARSATRAEFRQPGTMERILGGGGGSAFGGLGGAGRRGGGFGAALGGSLLGAVAGYVIGSTLVSAFLPWDGWGGDSWGGGDAGAADAGGGDFGDFGF